MIALMKQASTQASVVLRNETPCLLAVFKQSTPPLIWQFDLEKMSSHTISLREKEGEWELGLLLPQGVFTSVAHFDERHDAEEAYQAVTAALIRDARRGGTKKMGWFRRFLLLVLSFVVALFILGLFTPTANEPAKVAVQPGDTALQKAQVVPLAPPPTPKIETGVPVSADDVLESPSE